MVYYRSSVSEVINTVMLYGFALMAGQHVSHFMTSHSCLLCYMRRWSAGKGESWQFFCVYSGNHLCWLGWLLIVCRAPVTYILFQDVGFVYDRRPSWLSSVTNLTKWSSFCQWCVWGMINVWLACWLAQPLNARSFLITSLGFWFRCIRVTITSLLLFGRFIDK